MKIKNIIMGVNLILVMSLGSLFAASPVLFRTVTQTTTDVEIALIEKGLNVADIQLLKTLSSSIYDFISQETPDVRKFVSASDKEEASLMWALPYATLYTMRPNLRILSTQDRLARPSVSFHACELGHGILNDEQCEAALWWLEQAAIECAKRL